MVGGGVPMSHDALPTTRKRSTTRLHAPSAGQLMRRAGLTRRTTSPTRGSRPPTRLSQPMPRASSTAVREPSQPAVARCFKCLHGCWFYFFPPQCLRLIVPSEYRGGATSKDAPVPGHAGAGRPKHQICPRLSCTGSKIKHSVIKSQTNEEKSSPGGGP